MEIDTGKEHNISAEIQLNQDEIQSENTPLSEVGDKVSNAGTANKKPERVNSRDFVEKIEEILSETNKLFISKSAVWDLFGEVEFSSRTAVYNVYNGVGDRVFSIGHHPVQKNIQTFVIANSAGHGLMTFTTRGTLNRVCDIEGAGLLDFTQIQHIHGCTLRDPYKELVKIRSGWIPFSTCCLMPLNSTATMTVTDLDGTPTGCISFKQCPGYDGKTLCVDFIPNLNPKAKYMLFAASLRLLCSRFSESGRRRRLCYLNIFYLTLIMSLLTLIVIIRQSMIS